VVNTDLCPPAIQDRRRYGPGRPGISHQSISSFHRIPNTRIVDLANTVGSYQQASVYLFRSYDLLRLGHHVSSHALKLHIRP